VLRLIDEGQQVQVRQRLRPCGVIVTPAHTQRLHVR